jgi:hypothetical protein
MLLKSDIGQLRDWAILPGTSDTALLHLPDQLDMD